MCVQISCDHAKLSTELTIRHDESQNSCEPDDLVFWRAVASQRASELDVLRESIEKVNDSMVVVIIAVLFLL